MSSVDRAALRKLAEKLVRELPEYATNGWSAHGAFVSVADEASSELLEVIDPQTYRSMFAKYLAHLPPAAVLELLNEREHVLTEVEKVAASFYDRNQNGEGRPWFDASEELRELVAKLRSEP